MSTHHCHANACDTPTEPRLLMCPEHWRLVPAQMQSKVWSTFRARGNYPGRDPGKWADYYEACAAAVEHVARLEGKPERNAYRTTGAKFRAHAERKASEA